MNVLLITLDSVRPDHLPCYGYDKIKTPNIDKIANSGTKFHQAISTTPVTLASHTSILTGQEVYTHGVRENGMFKFKGNYPTVASILKENGYQTCAIVSAFVLDNKFGLDKGFDVYDDVFEKTNSGNWMGHPFKSFERNATEVSDRAINYLDKVKDKYFMWLHYFDPHPPYDLPDKFKKPNPEYGDYQYYDNAIEYIDEELGRVMDKIDLENTLVIIASDHGEALGEHKSDAGNKYYGHGEFLYEEEILSTLIFGRTGELAKKDVYEMVALSDIAPTILEFLDIPRIGMDAKSLFHLMDGTHVPITPLHKHLYCETLVPIRNGVEPVFCVRSENYKVIRMGDKSRVECLETKKMLKDLDKYSKRTKDANEMIEVDEDTKEKLAKLGYK